MTMIERLIRNRMKPAIMEALQSPDVQDALATAVREIRDEMWAKPETRFYMIAARQAGASMNDVKSYLAEFHEPFGHPDYNWSDAAAVEIGKDMSRDD